MTFIFFFYFCDQFKILILGLKIDTVLREFNETEDFCNMDGFLRSSESHQSIAEHFFKNTNFYVASACLGSFTKIKLSEKRF
jgi:hypothetical protein